MPAISWTQTAGWCRGVDRPARSRRIVGVIPAAGYATRLQPLTGSKETLSVAGRPVMDYLIERMMQARCGDIRVVTRPEKVDVVAHVDRRQLTLVTSHPQSVSESILAGLDGTRPRDLILIGFPDTIWYPADGFVRLLDALKGFEAALGLFRSSEPERSDVVEFEGSRVVTSVEVKPAEPRSDWIWGMAAARRRSLEVLADYPEPGAAFDSMSLSNTVAAVPFSGPFVDVGTQDALQAYLQNLDNSFGSTQLDT